MHTIRKTKTYFRKSKVRALLICAGILALTLWAAGSSVSAAVFDSDILPLTSGLNLGSVSRAWNDLIVNGKIGVKNTSPTYDVDITGGLRVTATSTFSGYLGVGTTTPSAFVHLGRAANDAYTALFVENGSAGASAIPQVAVGEDAVTKAFAFRYIGSGATNADLANTSSTGVFHAFTGAVNGLNIIASSSNGSIRFAAGGQTNSDLAMTIDGAGRIGIGTSTPVSGFHVLTTTSTFGSSANNAAGHMQLTGRAASPVSGRLTFGTDWQFRIAENQNGTIGDIMTVTDGNLVGIGTTAPSLGLHVAGNVAASSWIGAGCETGCSSDAYALLYGDGTFVLNPVSSGNIFSFNGSSLYVGASPPDTTKFHSAEDTASIYGASFRNSSNATNAYGIAVASGLTAGSGSACSTACRLMYFYDGDYTLLATITYSAGTVTYGTFTGAHYGEFKGEKAGLEYGDLLVSNGRYSPRYADSPEGEPIYGLVFSDKKNDEKIFGVYGGEVGPEEDGRNDMILVHALGNSFLKVTDTNGNIEIGDYLTSSPRSRFAERQDEEEFMNYSVAKAQVSVDWSEVATDPKLDFKWKMIPVSLHAQ
jgi:hypothetical protein